MTDLEKLIGDKQDQLRGRPRDWIDDFKDWCGRIDWELWFGMSLLFGPLIVLAILALP